MYAKRLISAAALAIILLIPACGGDSGNGPEPIPEGPKLSVSATSYHFGTAGTGFLFEINNVGEDELTWNISSGSNALTINPTSGNTISETDTVNVTLNRSELSVGLNQFEIYVQSNGGNETISVSATRQPSELTVAIPDMETSDCDHIVIPVMVGKFEAVSGVELHIAYDTALVTFDDVNKITSQYLSGAVVNAVDGVIHVIWADMSMNNPIDIPATDTLFNIHFTDLDDICALDFTSGAEISDTSGQALDLNLTGGSIKCMGP